MLDNMKQFRIEKPDIFNISALTLVYLIYQVLKMIVTFIFGERVGDILDWIGIGFNVLLALILLQHYFKYYKEMLDYEKKDVRFREEWKEFEEYLRQEGIPPIPRFNHKKARLEITVLTFGAVIINLAVTMITIIDLL